MVEDGWENIKHSGELLGLPGVGKTHILSSGYFATGESLSDYVVKRGWSFDKLKNIITGLRYDGFIVVFVMLKMINWPNIWGQVKLILVLLERLGRKNRYFGKDAIIDEGVMQAIWGFLWRTRIKSSVFKNTILIIQRLSKYIGTIYYVGCRKSSNIDRLNIRAKSSPNVKNIFSNAESYQRGRRAMVMLLCAIRKNGHKFKYIDNIN